MEEKENQETVEELLQSEEAERFKQNFGFQSEENKTNDSENEKNNEETEEVEETVQSDLKAEKEKQDLADFLRRLPANAAKAVKSVIFFTAGVFRSSPTYNPNEHIRTLLEEEPNAFDELNETYNKKDKGEYKTKAYLSLEETFGKEFVEQISTDSMKMLTYNQIFNQIKKMDDPSLFKPEHFRPDFDRQKSLAIFEAQKLGFDTSLYQILSPMASQIVLNAQKNGITQEQLIKLVNTRDEAMEEVANEMLKENGKQVAENFVFNEEMISFDEKLVSLDDALSKAREEYIKEQNDSTRENHEITDNMEH